MAKVLLTKVMKFWFISAHPTSIGHNSQVYSLAEMTVSVLLNMGSDDIEVDFMEV